MTTATAAPVTRPATVTITHRGRTYTLRAVKARAWESWERGVLAPKVRYLCGRCLAENHKRPLTERTLRLCVSRCENCGQANVFHSRGGWLATE